MKRVLAAIVLLLAVCAAFPAQAEEPLKLGILAYRPKPQTIAQWQPVAAYLETALGRPVVLSVYDHAELSAAATRRAVDVVITTANHFILLHQNSGLSAPLATLVSREGDNELRAYGGAIIARADHAGIASLADLSGKRVAAASMDALGGYQMQAFELLESGVRLPAGDRLLLTGQPHDLVIDAVLAGRADAGFVRAGLLEQLEQAGKLDLKQIRVINRQNLPGFPYMVSTRLYPEWPVAVMPQVDQRLATSLAAALFQFAPGSLTGSAASIQGFTTPANYDGVEILMRRLRLPPFDRVPEFTLDDMWHRYSAWIVTLAGLMLLLAGASAGLVFLYRQSQRSFYQLERMAAKEKLILASLAEGVYGVGTQCECIFVNPRSLAMLGFTESEVIGRNTHHLFHERKGGVAPHTDRVCPLALTLHDGVRREEESIYFHKDGREFPVLMATSAMREGGAIVGAVVVFQDITERKRIVEELRQYKDHLEETVEKRTAELHLARDAAEAANKAKSVFLANMSHELRTPLNAVLGFSAMLRQEPGLSAGQREKLDIINRSGSHLLTIINAVLEMAKIEAGRMQVEVAPFDLGSMVREVADMMRLRAQEKGLRLGLDQSSAFPRYVRGDEARLRQVILNIADNAIKFTKDGGVNIRFGVKKDVPGHLLIEVEDTGPGIPPESLKRLFQPFVQLTEDGARTGTGLGLAISRQFMELMGGTIGVDSTPGKGSVFRIELTAELPSEAELARLPGMTAPGEVAGLAPGQPVYRILIVEDQREGQLLLAKLMTDLGVEVRIAENGEKAVKLFEEWHPHLIWMDRRMPVMDGVQATIAIRKLPGGKDAKIVAVTASVFKEQQEEMLAAGMDDFVRKPYQFKEIYDCLARHLGVKYVYRAPEYEVPEEAGPVALTPAMLAALTLALRHDLKEALESLDADRMRAVIGEITAIDAELGRALSRLADNFDYAAILKALASEAQ